MRRVDVTNPFSSLVPSISSNVRTAFVKKKEDEVGNGVRVRRICASELPLGSRSPLEGNRIRLLPLLSRAHY